MASSLSSDQWFQPTLGGRVVMTTAGGFRRVLLDRPRRGVSQELDQRIIRQVRPVARIALQVDEARAGGEAQDGTNGDVGMRGDGGTPEPPARIAEAPHHREIGEVRLCLDRVVYFDRRRLLDCRLARGPA